MTFDKERSESQEIKQIRTHTKAHQQIMTKSVSSQAYDQKTNTLPKDGHHHQQSEICFI